MPAFTIYSLRAHQHRELKPIWIHRLSASRARHHLLNTGGDGKTIELSLIPAGTVVCCFANGGAIRDRIPVAGTWLFVFPDNRSLKVPGIACNREADPSTMQFGDEDGSAGLKGDLVETNHWANAQAFLVLLMGQANQISTAAASGALSRYGGGGGVVLPDTSAIQAKYLDQLFNGQTGDSRYVHVASSTRILHLPDRLDFAARTVD